MISSPVPGQTLVGAVAQAVGSRPAASQELLGHFVRAGGGDVGKAASLYLAVAEEFVELRDLARFVSFSIQTSCWGDGERILKSFKM